MDHSSNTKATLIENNLLKKYIKLSDPLIKKDIHLKYKYFMNLLSTILKKGKQSDHEKFFRNNLNEIKSIWKGIRNFTSFKQSPKSNIHLLSHNSETITDSKNTASISNGCFSTIAEKTKNKIKFSNKSFAGFSISLLMIHFSLKLQIAEKSWIVISKLTLFRVGLFGAAYR